MSPKVGATFDVEGTITGCSTIPPLRIQFTLLDDGRSWLLGVATPLAPSVKTQQISIQNGYANEDLFESTSDHPVYSCRFTLICYDAHEATIIGCAARLSPTTGLIGRWNYDDTLGKTRDGDYAFTMEPVVVLAPDLLDAKEQSALQDGLHWEDEDSSSEGVGLSEQDEDRELFFEGEAVDLSGHVYNVQMTATFCANGLIKGISMENGNKCHLAGSYDKELVEFQLEFPVGDEGDVAVYHYKGVLSKDALTGTWEYENDLSGTFSYRCVSSTTSTTSGQRGDGKAQLLTPGKYVFTGCATSDDKTKYKSTLTLHLQADGSVMGQCKEESIAPQVCALVGTWQASQITYTLTYTDGCTATYKYTGQMNKDKNKFTGRWKNTETATRSKGERGNFRFWLESFQATDSEQPANVTQLAVKEESLGSEDVVACLTAQEECEEEAQSSEQEDEKKEDDSFELLSKPE